MPCAMTKGSKIVYSRGVQLNDKNRKVSLTVGGFDNQISISDFLVGQVLMKVNAAYIHQGSALNFKSSGLHLERHWKKNYMFYVFHTRMYDHQQRFYSWKYYTNSLDNLMKWYKNKRQFWQKPAFNAATGLFVQTSKGTRVVRLEKTQDLRAKAMIVGKAWTDTKQKVLDNACFNKFANRTGDFAIFAAPGQIPFLKEYSLHSTKNFHTWSKEMRARN